MQNKVTKKKEWVEKELSVNEKLEIKHLFKENFSNNLQNDEEITINSDYTKEALYLTIILHNKDKSFYYPFETAFFRKDNKEHSQKEALEITLSFINNYFEDFFENNRNLYIAIDWTEYKISNAKIYAKAKLVNKKLEEEANKLLNKIN